MVLSRLEGSIRSDADFKEFLNALEAENKSAKNSSLRLDSGAPVSGPPVRQRTDDVIITPLIAELRAKRRERYSEAQLLREIQTQKTCCEQYYLFGSVLNSLMVHLRTFYSFACVSIHVSLNPIEMSRSLPPEVTGVVQVLGQRRPRRRVRRPRRRKRPLTRMLIS